MTLYARKPALSPTHTLSFLSLLLLLLRLDPNETQVRINCLVCLGKLLTVMDKWFFLDSLLPMLAEVTSREAGTLMAILGIFHTAFQDKEKFGLDHNILACRVSDRQTEVVVRCVKKFSVRCLSSDVHLSSR